MLATTPYNLLEACFYSTRFSSPSLPFSYFVLTLTSRTGRIQDIKYVYILRGHETTGCTNRVHRTINIAVADAESETNILAESKSSLQEMVVVTYHNILRVFPAHRSTPVSSETSS